MAGIAARSVLGASLVLAGSLLLLPALSSILYPPPGRLEFYLESVPWIAAAADLGLTLLLGGLSMWRPKMASPDRRTWVAAGVFVGTIALVIMAATMSSLGLVCLPPFIDPRGVPVGPPPPFSQIVRGP